MPTGIIFSNNGSPQTSDMTFTNGGYYMKDVLIDVVTPGTGINDVRHDAIMNGRIYTLDGRLMPTTDVNALPRGIYIVNGKKIVR